jgi:hypothetical protein
VERTADLVRIQVGELRKLGEVLDHWGGLIRVTRVMGQAVIDSEEWVQEINSAVALMRRRTLLAARKLRAIMTSTKPSVRELEDGT